MACHAQQTTLLDSHRNAKVEHTKFSSTQVIQLQNIQLHWIYYSVKKEQYFSTKRLLNTPIGYFSMSIFLTIPNGFFSKFDPKFVFVVRKAPSPLFLWNRSIEYLLHSRLSNKTSGWKTWLWSWLSFSQVIKPKVSHFLKI